MPLHVALTHRTTYQYDRLVQPGPQTIRLRPAPHSRTPILAYQLTVEPKPHFLNWQQDPQGNHLARVVFPERVTHFDVTVDLVADMVTINPFDFFLEPEAEQWPFTYDPALDSELIPYLRVDPPGPELAKLIAAVPRTPQKTVDMLVALNQLIQQKIEYVVRLEPGVQTAEESLLLTRGSCRDSAWLSVQLFRHLGFAARFVSGYLLQLAPDIRPLEGPQGPTADFTDLHAWTEVYLPGAGWIGFDATSGLLAGEGHIPLAASPEPSSAAAISGVVEKCETEFGFEMSIRRVLETPRVTKPYTEPQWQAILDTGEAVDRALHRGDVRLTMGGEPTFVSATDIDSPEWNTEATGPTKRHHADALLRRLMTRWAPGAALQHVMGKHYPGEQLPRWAFHCLWRNDGQPVWQDPALLATENSSSPVTPAGAAEFGRRLAERLQIDPSLLIPAYEDTHYYLWKEHRLPANVLAEDAKLNDPLERDRLAKIFGQGPHIVVGSVLPLRRVIDNGNRRWQSGHWFFRAGEMFLIPGDSPLGLRLPLESIPWADTETIQQEYEADPFAQRGPLPSRQPFQPRRPLPDSGIEGFRPRAQELPVIGRGEPDTIRTGLAIEPRDGKMHIFLPPLYAIEDWLDLLAAIEDTAAELAQPVVLEGYMPPEDERLTSFSVTPDPGVIEVNVHPVKTWSAQVKQTEELYAEARLSGLATEKFDIDGRHVGTGGGNHVVMGAAKPIDSPFLRRPDLLKSLLGFWHNHPSLSFLFSGQFIGPTSQHPRIDEARQDSLAELEIAFSQINAKQAVPPWLTDRLFRNILADMTGNTHRTEFCIDKMYTPDSASGRRGLVEFRALEMPPGTRMAAAQMLLMRAAVAAFWEHPYEHQLIRWGTRVHDDFMLPHYVERDFSLALDALKARGHALDPAWFTPHMGFRFPHIGATTVHDTHLELRAALEPWHVLGEEQSAGGITRYVDSSVERVQARVSGWVPERFVLCCNGRAVPLNETDREGEYVAGVRFKAWNPPSALHPTVGVQTPLILDVYDRWTGRSLGGMSYHTVHPGGLSYAHRPVNANEAEARRRSRFFPFGHTPGAMAEPMETRSREHPRTLDLRRV